MNKCIYSEKDDSTATFNSAEHIIPKCIGGIRCLPKGWVADEVNNGFSTLELSFSRENPLILFPKMFALDLGRKKHKNKFKVGIFNKCDNINEIFLGYVKDTKLFPLNQFVFSNLTEETINNGIEVKVILSPSSETAQEELIEALWDSIRKYNGCSSCIKNNQIPQNTYLLGKQDDRWILGVSEVENPETVKPLILHAIEKLLTYDYKNSSKNIHHSQSQATSHFTMRFNLEDSYRVYAKIAVNCLAYLKGQEFVLLPEFNNIREAILTGENILDYVCITEGRNIAKAIFSRYSGKISFGGQCHAVFFVSMDNYIYGIIALFGMDNPIKVKLTEFIGWSIDMYICDWQNKKDYKLIDCILKICENDIREETPLD